MMGGPDDDKIITDEEWKARALREKEALESTGADESDESDESDDDDVPDLPEASLLALVSDIAVRAMMALGQIPEPSSGKYFIDVATAKYSIDLLGVLEEKTEGRLTDTEQKVLTGTASELRALFVEILREVERQGVEGAGDGEPPPDDGEAPGPKLIV